MEGTKHVLGIIVDGARQLLGTVSLIEDVVCQRLEISQVCASSQLLWPSVQEADWDDILQESPSQAREVRMLRVVHLGNAPRVDPGPNCFAVDLNFLLRADDGERH